MKFSKFHKSPFKCSGVVSRGHPYRHDTKVFGLLDLENEGITKRRERISLPNDMILKLQKFWILMAYLLAAHL